MSDVIFIYVTCPNEVLAVRLANQLVTEKLIGCANILPGMKSIYRWDGKLQKSEEAVAILKTTREHYSVIEEKIRAQHEYKTPCIAILPIENGYLPYFEWIKNETTPSP